MKELKDINAIISIVSGALIVIGGIGLIVIGFIELRK